LSDKVNLDYLTVDVHQVNRHTPRARLGDRSLGCIISLLPKPDPFLQPKLCSDLYSDVYDM